MLIVKFIVCPFLTNNSAGNYDVSEVLLGLSTQEMKGTV